MRLATIALALALLLCPGCALRGFIDGDVDLVLDVPSVSPTPHDGEPRDATDDGGAPAARQEPEP